MLEVTIDFETRSFCDLMARGAWNYSLDPTTEAMCLAYSIGDTEPNIWHMAHPDAFIAESHPPEDLFEAIEQGCLVEAHNSFFEWCIWNHVMRPRYKWPEIKNTQWRCSAAKASVYALPRALGNAAIAMGLDTEKDMAGNRLMKKLSKPVKYTAKQLRDAKKAGIELPIWHEKEEDVVSNWEYCRQDVRTEKTLSKSLPPLSKKELRVWQMDQDMNRRGVCCDVEMAKAAVEIADDIKIELNTEFCELTGIEAASKRAAVKQWLSEQGLDLPDMQGSTLDEVLERPEELSPSIRRVLAIYRQVGLTSISKFKKMLSLVADDNRIRDIMMYSGASTGRWTGKGIQVHNFARGTVKDLDMEDACEAIIQGALTYIQSFYDDNILEVLSSTTRGALVSSTGKDFIVADYSAIEARILLWVAGDERALQVFRSGGDIYIDMAEGIYQRPIDKKKDPNERQMGKQAILGLGYQMGACKFLITIRKYKISFTEAECISIVGADYDELMLYWTEGFGVKLAKMAELGKEDLPELCLMKYIVDAYRLRYKDVSDLWSAQEEAAMAAVRDKGREIVAGKIRWRVSGKFLFCKLPSGRCIAYHTPQIQMRPMPWERKEAEEGKEVKRKETLTYMSVVGSAKKWIREDTYGGKIVENIVQAIARDIMAEAKVRVDNHPTYDMIMSVHDELIAEANEGEGDVTEFENLISLRSKWAEGCPISAEGWRGKRYKKG